ncbi:MAG: putative rane protein [Deltaproteobacteria bacterium]|jgi:uncharacterized iron-regulated membrane protein|nr:putative rane protein [Deltaproteobacteria bacterium]
MMFLLRTHASLMILALCMILSGAFIARFMRKKTWWFKAHRSFGITGVILFLVALTAIVLQITLTERAHFRVVHSWIGIVALGFVVLTPTLGILQFTLKNMAVKLRRLHRWSGRLAICIMFINVILGLFLIGIL